MVIFTYEDYLKYKEIQQYTLNLRKELEEEKIWQEKEKQTSYKYELNDVEEDYILKSGEANQFEVENVEIDKKIIKKVNNEHDKIFRTVLDKKTDVSKFLNKFLGLNIKAEELEKYNSSYIDKKFKNKEADIVYRLKDQNIFVLIEHQTKIDEDMPYRLLDYSNEIMRSAVEDKKYKKRPCVIPIVLYTGKRKWNIENNTKENKYLFKEIKSIDGDFNLIDINDFSEEELLNDDIFITKMMLVEKCKDETEIISTLEKITKIIKEEDKNTFRRIVKEILVLRIGEENTNKILEKIEEGSGNMMAVMEMLLAENEKYINIGRKEGRKEGKMQKLKEIVQKMLAENFSKDTISKITGLKKEEIDQLK